jgi:lysophospholipid acyltransferase (LPLAT)-like uncharacterized protein
MKDILLSYIAKVIIEVWFLFLRVKVVIPPETEALIKNKQGFILAGWHNQILSLTYHVSKYLQKKRKLKTTPLVSLSKDGEIIYQTFLRFQMESVRGSTSRGAVGGLKSLLKALKEGRVPIFTPDGPRGPKYKLQPGVIQTAAMTSLPIVHFYSSLDQFYEFKSWDRHRFPKLFSRQIIEYSSPIYIPKDANIDAEVARVEQSMLEQVERVDKQVGSS